MTNTINVPRELLENIVLCYNEGEFELGTLAAECHALLSAQSPAGVDGCKCSMSISMLGDGCRHCQPQEYIDRLGEMLDEERSELSDAQAIIDGLRGENEALHAQVKAMQSDANSWQSGYDEGRRMGAKHAVPVSEAKAQGVVQWPEADEIMQMAFEEGQPADDASGYCFELEEFDLFIERLMSEVARLNAAQAAPAADAGLIEALGYQALFDAIAAATSVYANGAVNISVQAFRDALAANRAKGVV